MKRKSSMHTRTQRASGQLASVSTSQPDPAAELAAIVAELSPHGRAALLTHARTIRDEQRRRGSRPPLMSLSLRDFVSRVQEAADDAITGIYGNKVFVAALYRMFEERGEASGCSLAEFKERLLTAQRASVLLLERCEGLDRTDATMTKSEIKYLGATYHFVVRKTR
jgi:hypothetical protein